MTPSSILWLLCMTVCTPLCVAQASVQKISTITCTTLKALSSIHPLPRTIYATTIRSHVTVTSTVPFTTTTTLSPTDSVLTVTQTSTTTGVSVSTSVSTSTVTATSTTTKTAICRPKRTASFYDNVVFCTRAVTFISTTQTISTSTFTVTATPSGFFPSSTKTIRTEASFWSITSETSTSTTTTTTTVQVKAPSCVSTFLMQATPDIYYAGSYASLMPSQGQYPYGEESLYTIQLGPMSDAAYFGIDSNMHLFTVVDSAAQYSFLDTEYGDRTLWLSSNVSQGSTVLHPLCTIGANNQVLCAATSGQNEFSHITPNYAFDYMGLTFPADRDTEDYYHPIKFIAVPGPAS